MTELQLSAGAYDRISEVPSAVANVEQCTVIGLRGIGGAMKSRGLHCDL
jgi:hypothetical protein